MKNGKRIYLTVLAIVTAIVVVVGLFRACGRPEVEEWDWSDYSEVTDEGVDAFTILKMDIGAGDVEIVGGDGYHITAQSRSEKYAPMIKQDGDTLTIKQKSLKAANLLNTNDWAVNITITVPRDVTLEKIDLDYGAGNLDVSGISCDLMDVDFGAGDIAFSACSFGTLDVDNGAGNFSIQNCPTKTLEIDSGMGDVDISGIGDPSEYTMKISVGVGDMSIEGLTSSASFGNDYKQKGSTQKSIDIDLGTGDVEITR